MDTIIQQITQLTGSYVPRVLGALVIIIIGWIIALLIASAIRKLLHRVPLDSRIAQWLSTGEQDRTLELEKGIARVLFYIIMLFVCVAAFQALGITLITEPINSLLTELFKFTPQLIGALALVIVAWIVAKLLKLLVLRILAASRLEERLNDKTGLEAGKLHVTQTLAEVVFWLVLLLFLPAILSTLKLEGLLRPVQEMMTKILLFIPNILTATIIVLVGWLVARITQRIVTSLFEAIGADRLSERVGLASALGSKKLSGVLGITVYVLILLPIMIAALNALQLDSVTQPASRMLEIIMTAIPNVFAAVLILTFSYIIGRIVAEVTANLLEGGGFNGVAAKMGISFKQGEGAWSPSTLVGKLVFIAIMLFAAIEAAAQLKFHIVSELFAQFSVLAGHVLLGVVIFAIGLYLASLAATAIKSTSIAQANFLAGAARSAILVFAGAMALRQMGLANEIINLTFGLSFGAIAAAVAIAFGFGGKETAGRELQTWVDSLKSRKSDK